MTSEEKKLVALGMCLGVLIATVLPAKIVPLTVAAIVVYVNRRDILRAVRNLVK